jgi:hypothetical protein
MWVDFDFVDVIHCYTFVDFMLAVFAFVVATEHLFLDAGE